MNRTALFARSPVGRRLEEQLQRCRELARSKGFASDRAQVFTERRRRAAASGQDRPVYGALLEAVRDRRCDMVICDSVIVLTADMREFADLWGLVRSGALRIVTVDGVDTGWLGTGSQ
jgi:DNA invertase Pin-like site-specific DNA recombinase